jgi:hypothetical protein
VIKDTYDSAGRGSEDFPYFLLAVGPMTSLSGRVKSPSHRWQRRSSRVRGLSIPTKEQYRRRLAHLPQVGHFQCSSWCKTKTSTELAVMSVNAKKVWWYFKQNELIQGRGARLQ